ncbi:MAG: 3-isopropylmalate dehydrogenase [Roseburia inulinivorans]
MNTNDDKIQWHPAFDAALQIELEAEAEYLEFEPEHLLSKKPMQIDVLVKNEKDVKIQKNIGRIFRQYNIIEYKSPDDRLNIDDFYKTYGYACLYKSETGAIDEIPATELTITFVCYNYPLKMLQRLEHDKKLIIENIENGIYYLIGDSIPIQLIIIPKLSKESNYWLNNLRNDLKSGGEIRNFIEQYGKKKNSKLYQALADTIMRANWKELKEERKMCEALRELFADDLRESREEGVLEGRNAGKIEGKIEQVIKKYQKGCTVDEAADMLEESPNLIRQIYDVIQHGTVNLDAEQIYKVLLENSCLETQK